jgi:hypothetical protein
MRWRALADRALRGGRARLYPSRPVLTPEYPLDLRARWGWNTRRCSPRSTRDWRPTARNTRIENRFGRLHLVLARAV